MRIFFYTIKQAFIQFGRNLNMSLISIFAITCMMLILSIFFIMAINVDTAAQAVKSDFVRGSIVMFEDDMAYVMDHFEDLVIKDTAEAGGYGVVFAGQMEPEAREDLRAKVRANPRRWIAQEIIDFCELPVHLQGERYRYRHAHGHEG